MKYSAKKYEVKVSPKLLNGVVNKWGDRMPMMACEEAGEFITSISKMGRASTVYELSEATNNLVKEMADLEISMAALRQMYGIPVGALNKAINEKLNKKK